MVGAWRSTERGGEKEKGAAGYYPTGGPAKAHEGGFADGLHTGVRQRNRYLRMKLSQFSCGANAWSDQVQVVCRWALSVALGGASRLLSWECWQDETRVPALTIATPVSSRGRFSPLHPEAVAGYHAAERP